MGSWRVISRRWRWRWRRRSGCVVEAGTNMTNVAVARTAMVRQGKDHGGKEKEKLK